MGMHALPKDADACRMEIAAAHIAMVADPALTRKTASLKKVILCYVLNYMYVCIIANVKLYCRR